jgi:hypothetical protein
MEQGALEYMAEIDAMGEGALRPGGGRESSHGWSESASATRGQPGPHSSSAPAGAGEPTPRTAGVYAPRTQYGRGVVAGINRGYFRRQIAEASYRFSEECEAGDRIIVGVNAYTDDSERPIEILQISHDVETTQNARLADFKTRRDAKAVARALDAIRSACQAKPMSTVHFPLAASNLHLTNVMPALIDAALANCTLGEMVQAMADVYGRYTGGPEW